MLGGGNSLQGGSAGPSQSGDARGGVSSSGRVAVSIATGGRGKADVSVTESPFVLVAVAAAVSAGVWWWLKGRK